MRLVLDTRNIHGQHDNFLSTHSAMVGGVLYDAGVFAVAQTIINPVFKPRTGALQRGTKASVVRLSSGKLLRITNRKAYAKSIEEGSKPHIIRARKAKFLRFIVGGHYVYRRFVRHPGTKPYWFLRSAVEHTGNEIRSRLLVAGMSRVARQFGR